MSVLYRKLAMLVPVVILVTLAVASAPNSAAGQDPQPLLAKMEIADGTSIVFLGDSITHQCLYTQYVEDYFYTRYPNVRLRIHNAGVGGARASDALARFDDDVAKYKPKYVTVLLGMNDGSYRPYDEAVFRTYQKDMNTLVSRIVKAGAAPILMTPTMYDARAARARSRARKRRSSETHELYNSVLAYYGSWLRDVAAREGHGFVDMYSPLNNITLQQRKNTPTFTMIPDAVHPGPDGQVVMAMAVVTDMGLKRQVSTIRVFRNQKSTAAGGSLKDVKFTDDGVTFGWTAASLPWVLPDVAAQGVKLTKLGHKMSREALEVHGLKPGKYELLIDGTAVGVYSSAALERHIELQANAKTPQYQQALAVAEVNRQRNDQFIKPLRGEWSRFQRWERMQRQLKQNPDNKKLAEQVATGAEQMKELAQRVARHEAGASELENKIFELNQPKPRAYQLRRVSASDSK